MRRVLFLFFCLIFQGTAFSQNEKMIHQTFDLSGVDRLSLDLVGEVEIEFWAGDNVLSETRIQLWDAPAHVLSFFAGEKKRYEIVESRNVSNLVLSANDPIRDPIRYKDTACFEAVRLRLFIPDSFETVGEGEYQRRK